MLSTFLDPKNDLAFKRIFGTDKHKDILIHFLNDVLGQNDGIKIVDVNLSLRNFRRRWKSGAIFSNMHPRRQKKSWCN